MSVPEPQFPSVYEFVDCLILPMYGSAGSRIRSVKWSAHWWAHPEAVARLDSLWRRYEFLRVDEPATFLETFLRNHADYHMRQLMADSSVFADCRREDTPTIPLPSAPMKDQKN
ncbi:DUF4913 domain-containing protein [Corynebacterium matruchotii]|jgi:hypothetical protein|uniref:Uncharacterized protein n=1 Tax=Corynebacterium matruchotii TaxID=43768 RepID=A0A6H9XEP9_9CORY|nr:DUF4913 domain-containing protein [Corynebacterium matruchotii]QIP45372.1 DUF4913 domain-containing protein [Corynebacterium matruchotii]SPW24389.1 Uncharacterised protein [Corynebacterium matruchotii]